MKPLKESIFSNIEDIVNNDTVLIEQFLKDNYDIHGTYNIDGNVVNVDGQIYVKSMNIESLTNGIFQFGKVNGSFYCHGCKNLKTLEGAPKEVEWGFYCHKCHNLKSLNYAPKIVGGNFNCNSCHKLTSLGGAPKDVGGFFDCHNCENLKSLKGAPEKVGLDFDCHDCKNLTSLEGAPEEVEGCFWCSGCRKLKITDQDRKKYIIES